MGEVEPNESTLQCLECRQKYKTSTGFTKHKCPKGVCLHCGSILQDLSKHRCSVQKINDFNMDDFNVDPFSTGKICDACQQWHPMTKNIHGFREWKGIDLCSDCYYHTSEIQQEVYALRVDFIVFLIHRGQVDCALCLQALICPLTGIQLHSYELDHCASESKSDSVGAMIMKGCPFTKICEESLKCRVLCVRCHSRVTYAQRSIGALRLKAEVRAQSMSMVDRIVQKLLFIDQCRML